MGKLPFYLSQTFFLVEYLLFSRGLTGRIALMHAIHASIH